MVRFLRLIWGRDDAAVRACSLPTKANQARFLVGYTHGLSHTVIVPDNDAVISRSPNPFIPALVNTHIASPLSTLTTSLLRATKISALHFSTSLRKRVNMYSVHAWRCELRLRASRDAPGAGVVSVERFARECGAGRHAPRVRSSLHERKASSGILPAALPNATSTLLRDIRIGSTRGCGMKARKWRRGRMRVVQGERRYLSRTFFGYYVHVCHEFLLVALRSLLKAVHGQMSTFESTKMATWSSARRTRRTPLFGGCKGSLSISHSLHMACDMGFLLTRYVSFQRKYSLYSSGFASSLFRYSARSLGLAKSLVSMSDSLIVRAAVHDGHHAVLHHSEQLLRHVVPAQRVLERQVELVFPVEHPVALLRHPTSAIEGPALPVHVHFDVLPKFFHVRLSLAGSFASGHEPRD
ncbi:hypothetical protein PR048_024855 [Dryococelus australis]|uniref:Uncharacterized protein n=1 Tax=Dryococelus australis TaxID=614101 RepID=A0ABQ9GPQ5_9NEOP|nr:hypothetical protein PR048_024855 [Dryococelus australis]